MDFPVWGSVFGLMMVFVPAIFSSSMRAERLFLSFRYPAYSLSREFGMISFMMLFGGFGRVFWGLVITSFWAVGFMDGAMGTRRDRIFIRANQGITDYDENITYSVRSHSFLRFCGNACINLCDSTGHVVSVQKIMSHALWGWFIIFWFLFLSYTERSWYSW